MPYKDIEVYKQKNILYCKNNNILCLNCQKVLTLKTHKYCNNNCRQSYEWKLKKSKFILTGKWEGANHDSVISRHLKRYLIETRGHKCEICKNTEWMGKEIPLIIDHIDGHAHNHTIENTRLVCGNCDMQLPTYKSKNKNSDRKKRIGVY